MVPEAPLEHTEQGLVPRGEGWFVLNARDAAWRDRKDRGAVCVFEEEGSEFPQVGVNLQVLGPGQPMAMYHWEADQEDFLVLAGEATLIAEGAERQLRRWDFVHCPPGMDHVIVGAGSGPCVIVCMGARVESVGENWGGYVVDEAAARLGASVEAETADPDEAYARFPRSEPAAFRPEWLPPDLLG